MDSVLDVINYRVKAHLFTMPELQELITRSTEIRDGIDHDTAMLLDPTISRVEKEMHADMIRHLRFVSRLLDDEIDRMSYKLGK